MLSTIEFIDHRTVNSEALECSDRGFKLLHFPAMTWRNWTKLRKAFEFRPVPSSKFESGTFQIRNMSVKHSTAKLGRIMFYFYSSVTKLRGKLHPKMFHGKSRGGSSYGSKL
jgi:hypothetical protein